MGERIDPRDNGVPCVNFHEPDETPPFIYVYFWGIDSCPGIDAPPNGELFKCYQMDGLPCKWVHDTPDSKWSVELQMLGAPISTHLQLFLNHAEAYFNDLRPGFTFEHDILEGDVEDCSESVGGSGGFAIVFWLDAVDIIVLGFNFHRDPALFLEFFMIGDTTPVYKLCNTRYHQNQTFKVDI